MTWETKAIIFENGGLQNIKYDELRVTLLHMRKNMSIGFTRMKEETSIVQRGSYKRGGHSAI